MANSRYIKIIQWNCQGAIGKQNAIVHAVKTENLDICLLQDTRIKIKPDKKLPIKICGYNTFFIPHAPGESPGLITFIKKSIPVENYQLPPLGDHTHTLSIKIFINQTPYLIHNIYRVSGITQLDPLFTNPTPSIIAGDFIVITHLGVAPPIVYLGSVYINIFKNPQSIYSLNLLAQQEDTIT